MPELDDVSSLILGNPPSQSTGGVNPNNLGNLRPAGQSTGFQQPASREQSIKDIDNQLKIYGEKHGINTLRGVISRWAPPNENDTEAYIKAVSQRTGLKPEDKINLSDPAVRHIISGPIIIQEKGLKNIIGGGQQTQQQDQGDDVSNLILGTQQPSQTKQKQYAPTDIIASKVLNKISPISVNPREVTEGSLGEKALGAGEAILSAAAPIVGVPLSAAAQLAYNITHGIRGDNPNQEVAQKVQQAISYEPKTEAGKKYAEQIGQVFEASKLPPVMPEVAGIVVGKRVPKAAVKGDRFAISGEQNIPSGGRNVGAAETPNATIIQEAISRATPERQAALKNVPPENIDLAALERQNKADKFGIDLTEGQRSQDVKLLSDEWNNRAKPGYEAYQEKFNERSPKLIEGINNIKEKAAPDIYSKDIIDLGNTAIEELKAKDMARLADIDSKYKALQEANGGQFPIDVSKLESNITEALKKSLKTSYVPSEIMSELKPILESGNMTFEQFEALRTNLAQEMRSNSNGNARAASAIIRQELENLPMPENLQAIKPMADAARAAVVERNKILNSNKAYANAVKDVRDVNELQRGVEHVGADKFIQKYVINGEKGSLKRLINELGEESIGHQALKAGLLEELKKSAGIVNETGEFAQKSFNNAVHNKIGSKLEEVMGHLSAQDIRDLAEVAHLTENIRKTGTANTSNTALVMAQEAAKGAAENAANWKLGGGLVPVGSMTRRFIEKATEGKKIKQSLKPEAGIVKKHKLKDIGKKD